MTITTYIEPGTGISFSTLPTIWNNTAGLADSNCESFGWTIHQEVIEDPLPEPEITAIQLDRDKLKVWITEHGRGALLNDWASLPLPLAEWWFLSCEYIPGHPNAIYLQNLLQLTDEDMQDLVTNCTKEEQV